jgi:hypothetical protein
LKKMSRELALILSINAFLVFVYLLWNWSEYSTLSPLYQVAVDAHFPWYIQFSGTTNGNALVAFFDVNWGLFIILLATFVNLYFFVRLQRRVDSKGSTAKI